MGLQILILQSCCQELCVSWKPRADWLCVAASLLLLLVFVQQRCVTLFSSSQTPTSTLIIKKMFLISQWMYSRKERHGDLWSRIIFIADSLGKVTICSFASSIQTLVIHFLHFLSCLYQSDEPWWSIGIYCVLFFLLPFFLSQMEVVKLWFTVRETFKLHQQLGSKIMCW